MCDHVHEWKYTRDRTHPFICHKCFPAGTLSIAEAESMLNEHAELVAELERLQIMAYRFIHRPEIWSVRGTAQFKVDAGLMNDEIAILADVFGGALKESGDTPRHVCGLQGYGLHWSDSCPACDALKEGE